MKPLCHAHVIGWFRIPEYLFLEQANKEFLYADKIITQMYDMLYVVVCPTYKEE